MAAFQPRNQREVTLPGDLVPGECVTFTDYGSWSNTPYQREAVISKVLSDGTVYLFPYRGTSELSRPELARYGWTATHHFDAMQRVSKSRITRLGFVWQEVA